MSKRRRIKFAPPIMDQATLAEWFHFTPDDLNANRNGALSAGQRERLERQLSRSQSQLVRDEVVLPLILVLGVSAACTWVSYIALPAMYYGCTGVTFGIAFFGSILVLNHLWTLVRPAGRQRRLSMREDVQKGRVEKAIVLVLSSDPFDENRHLEDHAGDLRLNHRAMDNLPMRTQYTAYYLPESKALLSLEPYLHMSNDNS